jgi:hypothetical protein
MKIVAVPQTSGHGAKKELTRLAMAIGVEMFSTAKELNVVLTEGVTTAMAVESWKLASNLYNKAVTEQTNQELGL